MVVFNFFVLAPTSVARKRPSVSSLASFSGFNPPNAYPAEFDDIIFWKQAEKLSILNSLANLMYVPEW